MEACISTQELASATGPLDFVQGQEAHLVIKTNGKGKPCRSQMNLTIFLSFTKLLQPRFPKLLLPSALQKFNFKPPLHRELQKPLFKIRLY
jgi:hypothetical protein